MVLRELPFPRGRQHRAKMLEVAEGVHVKVPGSPVVAPGPLPVPTLHVDALNDTVTKDGGNLVSAITGTDGRVYTLAGNVYHGAVNSPSGEPVYSVNAPDVGSFFRNTEAPNFDQPFLAIMVARLSAALGAYRACWGSTSFACEFGLESAGWRATSDGGTWLSSLTGVDNNWHVVEVLFNGASSDITIDGIQSVGSIGTGRSRGQTIFADRTLTSPWVGEIAESRFYDSALSAADRLAIRDAMTAKWITP